LSRADAEKVADRRTLLAARAELDRARVTLALHEVRAIVLPPQTATRAASARPAAAMLIGLIAPAIGTSRLGRWLRVASWALAAWRVVRNWRSAR
jgi:MFS superfamily sulfate permease-like transporter